MTPLLEIHNLHVGYKSRAGRTIPAVADVSFAVQPGEILGVLGESGSGKSTLAAAVLRLLPGNGETPKGAVVFEGQDLLRAEGRELEKIRGGRIGLILQEPSLALHPTIRVGSQVSDVLAAHGFIERHTRREKTLQLLSELFPAEAARIAESFPHQLSGGQQQRVLIAQAIACAPSLLIADEPTASLDPTTQQEILTLFRTLRQKSGLSIILITHNPALLAGLADRILVLYAGRIAEIGPAHRILSSPQHPYTQALLRCVPANDANQRSDRKTKLPVIPGDAPNLEVLLNGCRFEPRCADRMELCTKREPGTFAVGEAHAVSCFKYGA